MKNLVAACLLVLAGCAASNADSDGDPADVVTGSVEAPLASGAVRWLNGSYVGCVGRTGAWSARASGTDPMDNPALSVVKNDTTCVLALTGVVGDQPYTAALPMVLGTSFPVLATTFSAGATQFFGNARLESNAYAGNFQITFLYGGGDVVPTLDTGVVSGGYTAYTSSTATNLILPPTYTIDLSALRFQSTLLLFVGLTGQGTLTSGTVTGTSYVIEGGTLAASPTYAQADAAYNGAVATQKTIVGTTPTIAASEFGVIATTVLGSTQVRNLIIKRVSGPNKSYQIFRITFTT